VGARRRTWIIGISAGAGLVVLAAAITAARVPLSSNVLRERVISTLADRLDAEVELGDLTLRLYPGLRAVGTGLAIRHHGRRDVPPLISVERFTVDASLAGLWRKRVSRVVLDGLDIQIPPRRGPSDDPSAAESTTTESRLPPAQSIKQDTPSTPGSIDQVIIDEVVADNARLVILRRDKTKMPRTWSMHELSLRSVGSAQQMPFRSLLTNAVPPGTISTSGTFGPWSVEDPGETPLEGLFTFRDADLSVFKGIAGILSSEGSYDGTLDTISVHGETDTPDFTVSVGAHPVPLRTKYHAIVDATNGNTALERIEASFLGTSLVASGGVFEVKDVKGRLVTLDVVMDQGRIEDIMRLAVNTDMAPMVGSLALRTKFELPPGQADVVDKLRLDGQFAIEDGRFTNADVQQKINELSRRARGQKINGAAPQRVSSDFTGRFALRDGSLRLQRVTFNVPGAVVDLSGRYGLRTETLAFSGNLFMDAKISQTTTGVKSLLLKIVDPLFRKNGRTVVPLRVSGTRDMPSFGLDFGRVF
jgi:hypothetical protein